MSHTLLRNVRQNGRDAYLVASDTLYLSKTAVQPTAVGGVLLIRLDGIGDFFLWLASARILRDAFRDARVTLVAEAAFGDLAGGLGWFDEVISVSRRRLTTDLSYRYDLFDRIRRRRYDVALLPCYNRVGRFRDGEAIVRVARARRKVGSEGQPASGWQSGLSRRWYTELLPASEEPLHELDRNAEFVRELGIDDAPASSPFEPPPVADPPLPAGEPYFVLAPGAGFPIRQWPAERFALLAGRVVQATGWTGVLCGGPQDGALSSRIRRLAKVPLVDLAGRTTLAQLVELIRAARLVVGNETGAVHIAASVDTPAISITGGGHYGRFVPYPPEHSGPLVAAQPMSCFFCDWTCVYPLDDGAPAPCITAVSVDAVWSQVERVLRTTADRDDSTSHPHRFRTGREP